MTLPGPRRSVYHEPSSPAVRKIDGSFCGPTMVFPAVGPNVFCILLRTLCGTFRGLSLATFWPFQEETIKLVCGRRLSRASGCALAMLIKAKVPRRLPNKTVRFISYISFLFNSKLVNKSIKFAKTISSFFLYTFIHFQNETNNKRQEIVVQIFTFIYSLKSYIKQRQLWHSNCCPTNGT